MSSMNKKRRGPAVCTTPRNNVRLELHELELLVNTLEVETGINQAAVSIPICSIRPWRINYAGR